MSIGSRINRALHTPGRRWRDVTNDHGTTGTGAEWWMQSRDTLVYVCVDQGIWTIECHSDEVYDFGTRSSWSG